jgi:hydroxymethylbilane synthase
LTKSLRIATRGSALARWQAEHVAALLGGAELVIVQTAGDRDKTTSLSDLGGQGIFVKEVQHAVLEGRADLAVHSAKDLPSNPALLTPGLVIAAVPQRGDARDALAGARLFDLPPGATVATGSARRRALLADLRPDLTFTDLRGNIETRLAKVGDGIAAVVVAAAALQRLGLDDRADELLDVAMFVPQVAQGALAVECRVDDAATRAAVAPLEHRPSRRAVDAERAWLAAIGGGCDLPAGAHAIVDGDDIRLTAVLASYDGRVVLRAGMSGPDPLAVGTDLAAQLLERGGRWLIAG